MITKEQLAARLTGRQYGHEITREEEAEAKASGLLVIFGYSDDNLELRGAVHDEFGAYGCEGNGRNYIVSASGVVEEWDEFEQKSKDGAREWFSRERLPRATVHVIWGRPFGFAWELTPDVPHATFEVLEGEEKFCRGVVLAVADFKAPSP